MATDRRGTTSGLSLAEQRIRQQVDQAVRDRIRACPYGFYFNRVCWHLEDGVLYLSGSVPTYYLKQTLQTQLRDLDHVTRIENAVEVLNARGLSGV